MPLSMVSIGDEKKIVAFSSDQKMKNRLISMGFVPGRNIKIIEINAAGLIIEVNSVRIALNRGLAHLIQVI